MSKWIKSQRTLKQYSIGKTDEEVNKCSKGCIINNPWGEGLAVIRVTMSQRCDQLLLQAGLITLLPCASQRPCLGSFDCLLDPKCCANKHKTSQVRSLICTKIPSDSGCSMRLGLLKFSDEVNSLSTNFCIK